MSQDSESVFCTRKIRLYILRLTICRILGPFLSNSILFVKNDIFKPKEALDSFTKMSNQRLCESANAVYKVLDSAKYLTLRLECNFCIY